MRQYSFLMFTVFTLGCGDPAYTRLDAVTEIAEAWCDRQVDACGFPADLEDECVETLISNVCDRGPDLMEVDTCAGALSKETPISVGACVRDIERLQCGEYIDTEACRLDLY